MTSPLPHLTVEEASARLDVSQNPCELCRDEVDRTGIASGHVAAGHPAPRRVVHSMLGSFGADWDEDQVREFLVHADEIIEVPAAHWMARTGHGVAALGRLDPETTPRWYGFATKEAAR